MFKKSKIILVVVLICLMTMFSGNCYATKMDTIDVSNMINEQRYIQYHAHELAEHARALDIDEDDSIILTAQDVWNRAEEKIEALDTLANYTVQDVYYLSKTIYAEARGSNKTECAKVAWCILNRLDNGNYGSTIKSVVTAPNQFAYRQYTDGDTYYEISLDVLTRWCMEKCGITNVGRVLPNDYMQYRGDGKLNHYYKDYNDAQRGINEYTNWMGTPYE